MNFFKEYETHHDKVIENLKIALYSKDENIFDHIDFYDDDILYDPFIFSILNEDFEKWKEFVIFCFGKKGFEKQLHIQLDQDNCIYIPTIGRIKINKDLSERKIKLIRDSSNSLNVFDYENGSIDFAINNVKINNVQFLQSNHKLIDKLFFNHNGENVIVNKSIDNYESHLENFKNALNIIERVYPEYFSLIEKYIKLVVFYEGEPNSFATIQAHGAIFLNIKKEYNEIFFLDNILHQCAHVFFNTLTIEKKELFKISYNSPLSVFTGDYGDNQFTLYDRFHGLFTQTNINSCLEKCIYDKILGGDKHFELVGRFVSNMKRFKIGIKKFDKKNLYRQEGLKWFIFFEKKYKSLFKRNAELISKYEVDNQPYVFDYIIFKNSNRKS